MRPKFELRQMAYREAAAILADAISRVDLDSTLTEEEDNYVRKEIRERICYDLNKKGSLVK